MQPVLVAERNPRHARSISSLAGQQLEQVRLGDTIVLSFTGGSEVVIETTIRVDGPNGRVDAEPGLPASDVVATLLGDVVRSAWTHDTGDLHIAFGSGSELMVGADADVESWAVAGSDGALVVCLAHGELAVWGGQPRTRSAQ
jgi:hypothetical protein